MGHLTKVEIVWISALQLIDLPTLPSLLPHARERHRSLLLRQGEVALSGIRHRPSALITLSFLRLLFRYLVAQRCTEKLVCLAAFNALLKKTIYLTVFSPQLRHCRHRF